MHLNILAFAVPLFLAFIFLEYWVSHRQGKAYYSFTDSISNLSVGIAERLSDVFVAGVFYFIYDYLHRHYAIWSIQPTWYNWLLLLLATDFAWYWYHRLGHEVNLLWGLHIVHHQSPEFNFTTSARVTVFQAAARTCFWAVLPIIGFPAPMITTILVVHGLYPFFVHTQTVGKLGWLEYFLVTPSHHRVHHASNEQYLDKNYGDVFIFWDKLFGTFATEKETPVYGLTKPLNSYSFLWQHFHFLLEIGYAMRRTKGIMAKLRILFGRPDTIDPSIRPILERKFRIRGQQNPAPKRLNRYVLWQTVFTLSLLFVFVLFEHHIGWVSKTLLAGIILTTLINCGAILEQRKWVFHVEFMRLTIVGLIIFAYFPAMVVALGLLLFFVWSGLYYEHLRRRYLRLVYKRV